MGFNLSEWALRNRQIVLFLMIVLAFAVIQVLVHLVYFLHLDRSKEQRDNVIAFVFAGLVILLLVGLSIWIMFSIHTFMMAK